MAVSPGEDGTIVVQAHNPSNKRARIAKVEAAGPVMPDNPDVQPQWFPVGSNQADWTSEKGGPGYLDIPAGDTVEVGRIPLAFLDENVDQSAAQDSGFNLDVAVGR